MGKFEGFCMFSGEPGEAGAYTMSVNQALKTAQYNTTSVQRPDSDWIEYITTVSAVPNSVYDMWVKDELAQTLGAHAKQWSRLQPAQLYDGSAIPNTPVGSMLDLWEKEVHSHFSTGSDALLSALTKQHDTETLASYVIRSCEHNNQLLVGHPPSELVTAFKIGLFPTVQHDFTMLNFMQPSLKHHEWHMHHWSAAANLTRSRPSICQGP
jgi:hypothetical protein